MTRFTQGVQIATGFLLVVFTLACSNPNVDTNEGNEPPQRGSSEVGKHTGEAPSEGEEHTADPDHEQHEKGVIELTPEAVARVEIRTAPVEQRTLAGELSTTGQVDFDQTRVAHVSPRVSGRVHRVHAILGQEARSGQTLAEIDSIELGQAKAAFLQAKAKEELARKSFQRAESLLADRIASEQEVLEAEADLREAAVSLQAAEEMLQLYGLSQTQIDALSFEGRQGAIYPVRAPFAGTVVEHHVTRGELVTPERNLFRLADLSRVWIWIDIYQRDLGNVHLEDEVRASVDSYPGEVFVGKVSYLGAQVDQQTRTVRGRLDVDNPDGKLRPGMFVEVVLFDPHAEESGTARRASLVVPAGAVVREGEESQVFVAAGKHRYEVRRIQTGRTSGGFVEVVQGLASGESVVVEGAFHLKSAASKESLGGGHDH